MNIYEHCPEVRTKHFLLRLIKDDDYQTLFDCYHDQQAVSLMNDDNCDFGFYVETKDQLKETIKYWKYFYDQKCFVRFSIVDIITSNAISTIEGFVGDIGVLRVDLATAYEKTSYIEELLAFAKEHFYDYFGNDNIVTKAIDKASERREALVNQGFKYIGDYRGYQDYYHIRIKD
ncbi:MAG: hypothetical protein RBR97_16940 [Bacteroidales bacterium]|nr:hypothetical protein [Bacteroidales bacterium]